MSTKRSLEGGESTTPEKKLKPQLSPLEVLEKVKAQPGFRSQLVLIESDPGLLNTLQNAAHAISLNVEFKNVTSPGGTDCEWAVFIGNEQVSVGRDPQGNLKAAKAEAVKKALASLKKTCFSLEKLSTGEFIDVDEQSDIQGEEKLNDSNNVGARMMKLMGWSGSGGLGTSESGIVEPIKVDMHSHRRGLGSSPNNAKDLKEKFTALLKDFKKKNTMHSLVFSEKYTAAEREIIHQIARSYGLKSRSHGSDKNRKLIVLPKISRMEIVERLIKEGPSPYFSVIFPEMYDVHQSTCSDDPHTDDTAR